MCRVWQTCPKNGIRIVVVQPRKYQYTDMYHLLRRFSIGIGVLVLVACGTPTSDVRTPIIPTLTASVIVPTATVPVATATVVVLTATTAPTSDSDKVDVDALAYQTADGYHAFGRPDAPIVLTDYSDFF
jgi:hypothetical protein